MCRSQVIKCYLCRHIHVQWMEPCQHVDAACTVRPVYYFRKVFFCKHCTDEDRRKATEGGGPKRRGQRKEEDRLELSEWP